MSSKSKLKNRTLPILSLILFLLPFTAYAQETQEESFVQFINNDTDGSWFDEAILLNNECDFSKCSAKECAYRVFSDTIFRQECEYVSSQYGTRGRDWEVCGETAVDVNIFSNKKYYDDLGIEIFATSEKKVLHFEVTSSVDALRNFEYDKGREL